jgi:WD40 repeat protein
MHAGRGVGKIDPDGKLACARDGKTLAVDSIASEKDLQLWEIASTKQGRMFRGHVDPVHSAAISPDGRLLAPEGDGTTDRAWT